LYQGKEYITDFGYNNYDFMTRSYNPTTGRFNQVDGANQFASGYTGMGNMPTVGVDPDGQVVVAAIVGFFKNLFTSRDNFEPGANTRIGNAFRSSGRHIENSAKIWGGLFASDKNKPWYGRLAEIHSRFNWQLPQTIAGFAYSQTANLIKKVDGIEYYGGATFVKGGGIGGSVTLGSYINLSGNDDQANVGVFGDGGFTFMHEYGHYLQSQKYGFIYLTKVGIPSATGASWTELDANFRASKYFKEFENFDWEPNFYPISSSNHIYSQLPESKTNASWWEYPLFFIHPLILWPINQKKGKH
jgi:hypothetical protein